MGCDDELKSKILTVIYQRGEVSPEKISDITKSSVNQVKDCCNKLKIEKLIEECCGKYSIPAIVGVNADYTSGDDGCSGAG